MRRNVRVVNNMRIGSLCSGIGGLDLAVERFFDGQIVWQVENNKSASEVLACHWPGLPNLQNVITTDWTQIEPIDVLCAGYPCQPFSVAGHKKGVNDVRYLWPYVAEAIRVLRPRYVVLENVSGHLRLGFDKTLGDLAACGYDAKWAIVRASDIGACHQRARLFVVASNAGFDVPWLDPRTMETASNNIDTKNIFGFSNFRSIANTTNNNTFVWGKYEPAIKRWEIVIKRPAPRGVVNGQLSCDFVEWMMGFPAQWTATASMTQRLKMLGNAVVWQQALFALQHLFENQYANVNV